MSPLFNDYWLTKMINNVDFIRCEAWLSAIEHIKRSLCDDAKDLSKRVADYNIFLEIHKMKSCVVGIHFFT